MNEQQYKEQIHAMEDMMARTTNYLLDTQVDLVRRNEEISRINGSLLESIEFAHIIQKAFRPEMSLLDAFTRGSAHHIRNQIGIGGDSIVVKESKNGIYFGLLDATGHGIPAAMLSMTGTLLLNELAATSDCLNPQELLGQLNQRLFKGFNERRSLCHFEGSLCHISPERDKLIYAAAKGKGIHISADGRISDLQASKVSIGESADSTYGRYELPLAAGDRLLLYSDGLTDQFGGKKDKKFSRRRLKKLLLEGLLLPVSAASDQLIEAHENWKGTNDQTDDLSFLLIEI